MANLFGDLFGLSTDRGSSTQNTTKVTQKVLDQTAIDKLIYDVLSSDQGLAALASGENLSGGFNSSAKTLQTQDFLTKLIGELAIGTAKTVEEDTSKTVQKKSGAKTVICTELARQGLLDPELYEAGGPPSRQVSYTVWSGYHCWAVSVVEWMKESSKLSRTLLPVVESRYRYLTGAPGVHILGRATVYIGHPVCYLIGTVLKLRGGYGRASEFA